MDEQSSIPMVDVLVLGEGPVPADGFLAGQNPGWDEVAMFTEHGLTPRPFVGPAGQETDEYLRQVGVARPEIFITNCYKCMTHMDQVPTKEQLTSHLEILLEEIHLTKPKVIGGIGECSSRWLSWIAGQPFRDMGSEHGVPRWTKLDGHECILLPMYHSAAGLHNPDSMGVIFYDFQVFGKLLRGEVTPTQAGSFTPIPITIDNLGQLICILNAALPKELSIDTEGSKEIPWGLTFSRNGGVGCRLGAEQPDLLEAFNHLIHEHNFTIILQNSVHDIPILRALGVEVCDLPIIDTMILAYLLCVEPQGLKDLGWRHLKVAMEEYSSVADPVTEEKARKYLEKAAKIDWDKCPIIGCGAAGGLRHKHPNAMYPFTDASVKDGFTQKGNIKKKYFGQVNWCPGGAKDYPLVPLNKRIQKMLNPPPAKQAQSAVEAGVAFGEEEIPF